MPLPKVPQLPVRIPTLSSPMKVTVFGVSLSVALIGLLAFMFKRQRSKKFQEEKRKKAVAQRRSVLKERLPLPSNTNGELPNRSSRSISPSSLDRLNLLKQKSLSGSVSSLGGASTSTTSTVTHPVVDTTNMSPQELCQLGLETLQAAVSYWEDAVMKLGYLDDDSLLPAIPDPETSALQHHLEHLLETAYRMQDKYEREVEKENDILMFDTALTAFTEAENLAKKRSMSVASSSDMDSFVSATDMADLSDLDTHRELFHHLALYEAGLMELKHGNISCRTLRPEMTHCLSDTEFLAKLHCIRLALEVVFKDTGNRDYFTKMGRQIIGDLLLRAEKDPDDFYTPYSDMMDYVNNKDNWPQMEEELRGRGVKCFTFYDIVLDFIMMDAFDDLDNPPSSVIAVVQNRWLSNGFKETALSTACWSVVKAKRRLLKFSDGFISHFYSISENVSPVLAWGFLGPESELKDLCNYFKELVLGFIRDIFSFEKSRFTTVDDLAVDIVRHARERSEQAAKKLRVEPT